MDEELYTRDGNPRIRDEDHSGRIRNHASKLRNKDTAREYYGEKLRTGKADNRLTPEEERRRAKAKKQGKKKANENEAKRKASEKAKKAEREAAKSGFKSDAMGAVYGAGRMAGGTANILESATDDKNESTVAEEIFDTGGYIASGAVSHVTSKVRNQKYSNKVHRRKELSGEAAEEAARRQAQKEAQKKAAQKSAGAADNAGKIGRKITDKAQDLVSLIRENIVEFVKDNPLITLIIVAVFLIVIAFSSIMNACGSALSGLQGATIISSYTADDEDILGAEDDYRELEADLQEQLDNLEMATSGYDEVNYYLDEIGHNPYQLAAILTILFEDYKREEVQGMLQTIFDLQYEFYTEEEEETRQHEVEVNDIRWVEDPDYPNGGYWEPYTYTVTQDYQYYILNVYLINHTLDEVVGQLGFTEDEMARYEVLMETFGNKKYLFGEDDYYNTPDDHPGDDDNYHVPGEYLTDEQFARMLAEAESHLGTPYVWGGYSPSGFDCSGFVSWVINHCGNGWNVGRQTANGLRAITGYVDPSDAKPGDLIFFQGTYDTPGCSHVGIYVGNGMMIHAGNPVKYSSINTPYWQSHFHSFGRIN